jgi:hypothetical protein
MQQFNQLTNFTGGQGSLENGSGIIKNLVDKYVITPKGTKDNIHGISGFVFDIDKDKTVSHTLQLSRNYLEDTSHVEDHAVFDPVKITTGGFIGELVFSRNTVFNSALQLVNEKLGAVGSFFPQLTNQTQSKIIAVGSTIKQKAAYFDSAVNTGKSLVDVFAKSTPGETKQEKAFARLRSYIQSKALVTVETPWGYYDNMMITSMQARRSGETNMITEFDITLEEVRFAEVVFTTFDPKKFQTNAKGAASSEVDQGRANGSKKQLEAFLSKLLTLLRQ